MEVEKLRELADKKSGWAKADKDFLLPILDELGIEPPTKTSCQSCWRDAAIMALVKLGNEAPKKSGFRLKGTAATHGVFWCGKLISQATLNDDVIEWLKATGFPKHQYDED